MKRVVALVAIALVLGVAAAFGSFQVQQQADQRALAKFDTVDVLVTKAAVPAQTSLADAVTGGLVEKVKYPKQYLPLESLKSPNQITSSDVAPVNLPAGHLVLDGDFGVTVSQSRSLVIPVGMVAVSLDLTIADRTGGFIQPGKRVAVLTSTAGDASAPKATRVLFSSLLILAVGTNTVNGLSLTAAADNTQNVVTLALNPADAVDLVAASHNSVVTLALLSSGTIVSK